MSGKQNKNQDLKPKTGGIQRGTKRSTNFKLIHTKKL